MAPATAAGAETDKRLKGAAIVRTSSPGPWGVAISDSGTRICEVGEPSQDLGGLTIVVRALERAGAFAFLAHLAGDAPVTARDGVEFGQMAMTHLHGLIAVVDDQQAGHGLAILPCKNLGQPFKGGFQGQHAVDVVTPSRRDGSGQRRLEGGKGAMLWGWRRSFQIRPNGSRRRSIAFVVNQFGVKLARARRTAEVAAIACRPDQSFHEVMAKPTQPFAPRHGGIL